MTDAYTPKKTDGLVGFPAKKTEKDLETLKKNTYGFVNAKNGLTEYLEKRPYKEESITRDAEKLNEIYRDLDKNIAYFKSLRDAYRNLKEIKEKLELKYKFERIEKININKKMVDEQIRHNEKIKKRGDLPFPFRQIANTLFPI